MLVFWVCEIENVCVLVRVGVCGFVGKWALGLCVCGCVGICVIVFSKMLPLFGKMQRVFVSASFITKYLCFGCGFRVIEIDSN